MFYKSLEDEPKERSIINESLKEELFGFSKYWVGCGDQNENMETEYLFKVVHVKEEEMIFFIGPEGDIRGLVTMIMQ